MLPEFLGLAADETTAYRALITVPSAAADDLALLLDVTATTASALLIALERAGLAVRSLGDGERFIAAPPSSALGELLQRRRHELLRAEEELGVLDEVYRAATLRRGADGVVDVVHGSAAVRELFGRLQMGAREEVLSLVKAPVSVISAAENSAEDIAVARGVRYRVLIERAMLDSEPGVFEQIDRARAAGEQVRIAAALPLKLIVVDRELAFMPLQRSPRQPSGALLVHESGLLDALIALFEAEWARATAFVTEDGLTGGGVLGELDARIVSLLMAGLTDEAVAAHLGASLRTVQRRVRHLMDLTGGRTRMQLGFQIARRGWLDGT